MWVNCTNLFDAACGFGGYRESGYGREGGREGMLEYLTPKWLKQAAPLAAKRGEADRPSASIAPMLTGPAIDRTVKQYIGGKQARPDSGYCYPRFRAEGDCLAKRRSAIARTSATRSKRREASAGRRRRARPRAGDLLHRRKPFQRRDEIASAWPPLSERSKRTWKSSSIERIFTYAAWADKYDGAVHHPPGRNITIAMPEPVGAIGILPSEAPLLGLLSLVLPAIAVGNTVVAVPSEQYPLVTGDLYQVFDTSDLPGGVVNLVAGRPAELAKTLAEHDDVEAIWCFREAGDATVKTLRWET